MRADGTSGSTSPASDQRVQSLEPAVRILLVMLGVAILATGVTLRTQTLVSSEVDEVTTTRPLPGAPANKGVAATVTRKRSETRSPPSDALIGLVLALGGVLVIVGAFGSHIRKVGFGSASVEIGDTFKPAASESSRPTTSPVMDAAGTTRAGGAVTGLSELLVQDALAELDLLGARQALLPAREVRVAILSVGLDPQLAADRVLAGRLAAPEYVYGRTEHGTLMANHVGFVATAAPGAVIFPVGIFDSTGSGTMQDILRGLTAARRWSPDILFLDFGAPPELSGGRSDDRAKVERILADLGGALVVGAAGNSGSDEPHWPASLPGVLGVAATNETGRLAPFSNGGTRLAAPGSGLRMLAGIDGDQLIYEERSGTSLAAIVVTAVAALVLAARDQLTPRDVGDLLVNTGSPVPGAGTVRALDAKALVASLR